MLLILKRLGLNGYMSELSSLSEEHRVILPKAVFYTPTGGEYTEWIPSSGVFVDHKKVARVIDPTQGIDQREAVEAWDLKDSPEEFARYFARLALRVLPAQYDGIHLVWVNGSRMPLRGRSEITVIAEKGPGCILLIDPRKPEGIPEQNITTALGRLGSGSRLTQARNGGIAVVTSGVTVCATPDGTLIDPETVTI